MSFKDYLMEAPSFEGLDLTRDASPSREIDLLDCQCHFCEGEDEREACKTVYFPPE